MTSPPDVVDDDAASPRDPVRLVLRRRPPETVGIDEHFAETDPSNGWDLARNRQFSRLLKSRAFQFLLILPNQIIFWVVIFVGILGTLDPGLNFGTAITWYVWFCLVFVMMVVAGRAWCAMCPFGGFAEWVQRGALWQRAQRRLGLGLKMPEPVARYGYLLSVAAFLLLTWIEEYFNIAGPGEPRATSFMVLGIVTSALVFFLVFERRTFCRYICPLSSLIGSVGSMGSVAGFRTRDRDVCTSCETKDCMRGGADGYGCPWYTWPGSADSNASCGLCSECFKACPSGNIGLFLQKPLTSVIAVSRRRPDIAWSVAVLWGLVVFQQLNALDIYGTVDDWLNSATHLPGYPNPIDYLGLIAAITLVTAGVVWAMSRMLAKPGAVRSVSGTFLDRAGQFRAFFLPMMYGLIPVVGANYFARQLPKFFQHAPRVVPAVGHFFGAGSTSSRLYNAAILADPTIIKVQVGVMVAGTLAGAWTSWRIARRDLAAISRRPVVTQAAAVSLAVICGAVASVLYVIIQAAD